jgi:D-methionine transport system permease protein
MLIEIINAIWQTVYMVIISGVVATLIGIPIGILLETSKPGHILENGSLHRILNILINIGRSIPFVIILIAIIPFTRLMVGTSIGTTAAIVPLSVSAIPFLARLVENALMEIPRGLIEAARSMGSTPLQIIRYFLWPEALPSIVQAITVTLIALVGYSAMAGAIGGGGLGDLAIRYGYERFETGVMIITVILLVIFVQILQWIGNLLSQRFRR